VGSQHPGAQHGGKRANDDSMKHEHKRRKTVDNIDPMGLQTSKEVCTPASPIKRGMPSSPVKENAVGGKDDPMKEVSQTQTKQVYEGNYSANDKMVLQYSDKDGIVTAQKGHTPPHSGVAGTTNSSSPIGADAAPGESSGIDRLLCVICQDADRNLLFTPCNHICTCKKCGNNPTQLQKCPICRTFIEGRNPIYLS